MKNDRVLPEFNSNIQAANMLDRDIVDKILALRSCGWGAKSIAKELGISKRTVKRYIQCEIPHAIKRKTSKQLDGLSSWLEENYEKHAGNADVLRQQLIIEHNKNVSLRTVERAVQHLRQQALIKAKATIRFETPPGKQLQIDFGSRQVMIDGVKTKVYFFVATLGYSRRIYIRVSLHEKQAAWFSGIEGALSHFNGVPQQVLLDNAKPLVTSHDSTSKEVVFNERFKAFSKYWGFQPIACSPYRARTKGKDERMVAYVKNNAIAGRSFASLYELSAHLEKWNAEIADLRIHNSTQERPIERFLRDEAKELRELPRLPSFVQVRELFRKVQADSCVEVDTNYYSTPCDFIDKTVSVQVFEKELKIMHGGLVIAHHYVLDGRRQRVVIREHLKGIVGASKIPPISEERNSSELQRPLEEYELAVGGGW